MVMVKVSRTFKKTVIVKTLEDANVVIDESDGVVPDRSRNKEWPNIATSISPKLVSLDIARRGQAKTIVSPHQLDQGLLSTALLLIPHVDVVAGDVEETGTAHVHNLSVHPEVLEHLLLGHLPRSQNRSNMKCQLV